MVNYVFFISNNHILINIIGNQKSFNDFIIVNQQQSLNVDSRYNYVINPNYQLYDNEINEFRLICNGQFNLINPMQDAVFFRLPFNYTHILSDRNDVQILFCGENTNDDNYVGHWISTFYDARTKIVTVYNPLFGSKINNKSFLNILNPFGKFVTYK